MSFAPDTEHSLRNAAALVNTATPERLTDPAALDEFCARWRWTGSRTHDHHELAEVRRLRPRLGAFWSADAEAASGLVNTILSDARAMPQLVQHDEWPYHLHATSPEAPLATRMAVEAAMAFADMIRVDELDRLFVCAAEDCAHVGVDFSRNRSKRYCDDGCGNRIAVAAYRARRRA